MDKYQLNLLERGSFGFKSDLGDEKIESGESITLYQNENYKVGNYKIVITNPSVESVIYLGKRYAAKDNVVIVDFDFDNVGTELNISFKNGIADDCLLPINAVAADKGAFDIKVEKENNARLVSNVGLLVAAGDGLINVYFKKAEPSVSKIVVKVFRSGEEGIKYSIIEKEVDGEFLSITGLAYGDYYVVVEEYAGGKLLVSTDKGTSLQNKVNTVIKEIKSAAERISGTVKGTGRHTVVI